MPNTYADRLRLIWSFFQTVAYATFVLVLFFSAIALAQTTVPIEVVAPPPAMSWFDVVKTNFLSPAGVISAIVMVLGVVGRFAWATEQRKRILAQGVKHAFAIVEDIGNEIIGDDGFDKAARGLAELNKWLLLNKWRQMTPAEEALAKLNFQAIHGNEIAKAKVIAAAALTVDSMKAEEVTRPI